MNNYKANWLTAWDMAADDVLIVALTALPMVDIAAGSGIVPEHFPPGAHRMLWKALERLAQKNDDIEITETILLNEIAAWEKKLFNPDDVVNIWALCTQEKVKEANAQFFTNLDILKQHWFGGHVIEESENAIHDVVNGGNPEQAASRLTGALTNASVEQVYPGDAKSVADRYLTETLGESLKTGHSQIDALFQAMLRSEYIAGVGAYKMGKSTWMRNMLLYWLETNPDLRAVVVQLEDRINFLMWDFIAMLVAKYFLDNDLYRGRGTYANGKQGPLNIITTKYLMTRDWRNEAAPEQIEAIEWAINRWKSYGDRLTIYGKRKSDGGVKTLSSIYGKMNWHKRFNPADIWLVDYFQKIVVDIDENHHTVTQTLNYQRRNEIASLILRDACDEFNMLGFILAQKNEEGVKQSENARNKSHSINIKGGGDLAQDSSYGVVIETGENSRAMDDNKLFIDLHFARRQAGGSELQQITIPLHPQSRLMLDTADPKVQKAIIANIDY